MRLRASHYCHPMECAGRAERRRRFGSFGAVPLITKAVSRFFGFDLFQLPLRSPKLHIMPGAAGSKTREDSGNKSARKTPTHLKFWGVRGSIPTPGPTTIRYGGNTSCIE